MEDKEYLQDRIKIYFKDFEMMLFHKMMQLVLFEELSSNEAIEICNSYLDSMNCLEADVLRGFEIKTIEEYWKE